MHMASDEDLWDTRVPDSRIEPHHCYCEEVRGATAKGGCGTTAGCLAGREHKPAPVCGIDAKTT
jgi:hypothetical protein